MEDVRHEPFTLQKPLREMTDAELDRLAEELRQEILQTVSQNGGHLASNLGAVEATIAIHRVFDLPKDRLIFDVGHQCYAHKLLTGRGERFHTLRQRDGLSGFTKRSESECDPFGAGHAGTSLSAALGFAEADLLAGRDRHTVAFVGDGAFTNGMIYEALNNCSDKRLRLILILNENDMSISPNVGGLSRYLTRIRVSKGYFTFKHRFQSLLKKVPRIGESLIKGSRRLKNTVKRTLMTGNLFEHLGVHYLGPLDGHDRRLLERVLEEAKRREGCTLVHICTKKGKGYPPAEEHPERYHSVSPFDLSVGASASSQPTFSDVFGELMVRAGKSDPALCAVTAAMSEGTGLYPFSCAFPERFYDVGIAEEHAMTFAAGLSAAGMRPVYAVYSTFAQRCNDQLFHDSLIQSLPLTLVFDRCGLVPGDGVTHQGIYDVSIYAAMPGVCIYSPANYADLYRCFEAAVDPNRSELCTILRLPRGRENQTDLSCLTDHETGGFRTFGETGAKKVLITYGRLSANALEAAKAAGVKLISLLRIAPLDREALVAEIGGAETLYHAEEGV